MNPLQTLEWWTVREVANRWRVSEATILRQIKTGHIQAMRIGDQYRIHQRTIDEHEADGKAEPVEGGKVLKVERKRRHQSDDCPDYFSDAKA